MDAVTFSLSWNKVVDSVSFSILLFTACVIQLQDIEEFVALSAWIYLHISREPVYAME